jgi:hypothetical protein
MNEAHDSATDEEELGPNAAGSQLSVEPGERVDDGVAGQERHGSLKVAGERTLVEPQMQVVERTLPALA